MTRFFSPAGQFMYTELLGAGKSMWRRYYTDKRVEKRRVEYSIKGTLHRETLFVENSSIISWISYLDDSGRAFFTQWMDVEGNRADVFVADGPGSSTRYSSLEEAQEEWFHSMASQLRGPLIVMIDDCTMSPVVENLRLKNAKIIAIFHKDHNTPAHRPMIDGMGSWDAVVCSTQGQARVLEEVVPQSLGITSIAQPIPDRSITRESDDKPAGRFAFFGRLIPIKNVLPLVSSFVRVSRVVPMASLDIYGSGPLEPQLRELIAELNLQEKVRLMGRTDHPVARMAEYSAVIVPSSFEAFGLVIGEAMLAATPVIAFDCDFGPRDIISHGVDGTLVDAGDFEKLSDHMIYVSGNPDEADAMGRAGRKSVLERFGNDRIMAQWEKLIDVLLAIDEVSGPAVSRIAD